VSLTVTNNNRLRQPTIYRQSLNYQRIIPPMGYLVISAYIVPTSLSPTP